mmetsp:Transcript_26688/g.74605  ORF Transcript_26688/g.74605 Transcript_26688/m.74605 type:complete len:229 (-) Transcript_26688:83-769(-)|eukprot:CAMPEP_0119132236 /NCGR_PEP_ID=MMETSP1310-20130426/11733_1 /TAXON_ID=464262 /ORGANISM="Genus nov. species nov., Strain RCC2339" /LENGTH=228 /DNA_ID=CAMNT_0007122859 /DNA_START=118 /DNA_END=804 /DNA_ORIENTATION=-
MATAIRLDRFVEFSRKVVCIGRNYADHAKELGNAVPKRPFFFLKPPSSLVEFDGTAPAEVMIPRGCSHVAYELELGVVIAGRCKDVTAIEAMSHVGGYTLALDMTSREHQEVAKAKGLPWSECKGYDTFCPVGQFIPAARVRSPDALRIQLEVDGQLKQNDLTSLMIFDVPRLIEHLSGIMTLERGDVILTGTPKGVGNLVENQRLSGRLLQDDEILGSLEAVIRTTN